MRASQLLLATLKETPNDAQIVSHQLMLRAGMVRSLGSGLYTWLPLGLKVVRKIEQLVREEMNKAGAQEVLMPGVQPAELWQESGRWEEYGKELLRLKDRHGRDFCLGPTHEEVITDLARKELRSYKQLPTNFYQIQTKFRDEIRPRFGVMRAREFIMKDAYSFHLSQECLETTYNAMYEAYTQIFTRMGLNFRSVLADNGSIGGSGSHEFHVLAASGEDAIVFSNSSNYAANLEKATALAPEGPAPAPAEEMRLVDTPQVKTIQDLVEGFSLEIEKTLKTLIVKLEDASLVALVLRGDHELNEIKAANLLGISGELEFASDAEIEAAIGASPGSLGPVNLELPCYVDLSAAVVSDFAVGANKNNQHLFGVNWERDVALPKIADLRQVVEGDLSPDGQGTLEIKRGIEVGHIFQLGTQYSANLNATVLNEQGKDQVLTMGCYGIGITRLVAAAIEQNHDEHGIIWPAAIAPYQVALIPMNATKSELVKTTSEEIYQQLLAAGVEVLLDDRDERPGVKFADLELIGIPHRFVLGERSLKNGEIEYKNRATGEVKNLALAELSNFIAEIC